MSNENYWREKYRNAKEMLELADEGTQLYSDAEESMYAAKDELEILGITV